MKKLIQLQLLIVSCLLWILFSSSACRLNAELEQEKLQSFKTYFTRPGRPDPENKAALLKIINSSQREIMAVFTSLTDEEVTNAILARHSNNRVTVYMAGDKASKRNSGFRMLDSQDSITVQFGDSNEDTESRTRANNSLPPRDGRVETNVLIADRERCWISTSSPTQEGFEQSYAISLSIRSTELCTDFYNDARLMAQGGLFSEEGGKLERHANDGFFDNQAVSFGKFNHNKGIPDPNSRFTFGEHTLSTFFAWQERPLNTLITRLLNTRESIEFATRAITSDIIQNKNVSAMNRSHILNTFEYKNQIPQRFGGTFHIKGVFGNELLGTETPEGKLDYRTSIHTAMRSFPETNPNARLRRNNGKITFNLYVLDKGTSRAQVVLMSSDLRLRYYEEGFTVNFGAGQEASKNKDYYDITDAFMLIIEPSGSATPDTVFNNFSNFINEIYESGGTL